MSCSSVFCCLSNNYMISFKSSKCNIISQSQYDSEIRRICSCISSFPCPFCESFSLIFWCSTIFTVATPKKDLCTWLTWIHHYQSTACLLHALPQNTCTSSWSLDASFSDSCFTCFCYCFSFPSSVLCFPEYLLSSDRQISIFTY